MLNILLSGACGRMGKQVTALANENDVRIVAGVDLNAAIASAPFPLYASFDEVKEIPQAVVDFSTPALLPALLSYALLRHVPLVLAATGYSEGDLQAIADAAKEIPIFRSANMSLGIYVLRLLSRQAAALLPAFDIEIVEKHHRKKVDAPSGTALMLLDAVKKQDTLPVYDRHARRMERDPKEIGMHAVRGGSVAGEHEVGFYGQGEQLLLTHSASDRSIFARGALQAAHFIASCTPGAYTMEELAAAIICEK